MTLQISFPAVETGNTVPYPPLFDDIRCNYGFVDLRDHPEKISLIQEAAQSAALQSLLSNLARPLSEVFSLGCDLGQHIEKHKPLSTRRVAGGYVQIALSAIANNEPGKLRLVVADAERRLREDLGSDSWELKFELKPTHFRFGELIEAYSIWIWFFASSSTVSRAIASRERLILAVARILDHRTKA